MGMPGIINHIRTGTKWSHLLLKPLAYGLQSLLTTVIASAATQSPQCRKEPWGLLPLEASGRYRFPLKQRARNDRLAPTLPQP